MDVGSDDRRHDHSLDSGHRKTIGYEGGHQYRAVNDDTSVTNGESDEDLVFIQQMPASRVDYCSRCRHDTNQ